MIKKLLISALLISMVQLLSAQKLDLTLEDAILYQGNKLKPQKMYNLAWRPSANTVTYTNWQGKVLLQESLSGAIDTLLKFEDVYDFDDELPIIEFNGYHWISEDLLFLNGAGKSGYHYSFKDGKAIRVFAAKTPEETEENRDIHYVSGQMAFTRENNLYIVKGNDEIVVTQNTDPNIVSGQSIARNEFGISKGTFWSPSGNMLAFYQKDECAVSEYPLLNIKTTPGSADMIKYPMAGQTSEVVQVCIYHTLTRNTVCLSSPKEEYDYMTNLAWDPSENFVYVAELNRGQNHMKLNKYNALTGELVSTLFEEKSDTWVEPEHAPFFVNGTKNKFIWLSERDGFTNLYLYNTDGKLVKQLTQNNWETKEIIGSDAKGKHVFISGTGEDASETNVYKIQISNGEQSLLTRGKGTNKGILSPEGSYLINSFSSTVIPSIVSVIYTKDGYLKHHLLHSENPLTGYKMGKPEFLTIKSADGVTDLQARIIKPSDFNEDKKYPVIVYVYGGPHVKLVRNEWLGGAPLWMYYQAERGYIIFTVDSRGSAYRGKKFEEGIFRQMGTIEIEDQEKGVEYLKSLPYVDDNKLAVHGWSYGGFMTSSLMLRKPDLFKVGVAGGPVTDWKYYEAMYGERYMDTPAENPEGYENARLAKYVKNLKGDLLLIHGSVDPTVVLQHNYALLKAFVDEGVQVDYFVYPMHPHNVRGKDRIHLMTKVLNYIEDKLED